MITIEVDKNKAFQHSNAKNYIFVFTPLPFQLSFYWYLSLALDTEKTLLVKGQ